MGKACCIYRIDDITPGMNWEKFYRYLDLFQKYHVVPLVGVVPDNLDPSLTVGKEEANFWRILRKLRSEGRIEISQHGYQHRYTTGCIQPFLKFCGFKPQSEFSGLSYMIQYERIKAGKEIMERNGIPADIWMAPGHSYDRNTLKALKRLKFRAITDGIGLYPERRKGLVLVPQQEWWPVRSRIGVRTICLHLNGADEKLYRSIEKHLQTDPNIVPFSSVLKDRATMLQSLANHLYKLAFLFKVARNKMRRFL